MISGLWRMTRPGLIALLLCLVLGSATSEETISGKARLGWVFIDEDGNESVDQSVYNVYEGLALSLDDWRYSGDNGLLFTADLENVTLNNRNLRGRLSKPGLFSLGVTNNQYRRKYSFDGEDFTRRRTTSVNASVKPIRYVRLFGGFTRTDKQGEDLLLLSPVADTIDLSTDYTIQSYSVGTQVGDRYGFVRAEYRRFEFTDDLNASSDREADQFDLTATTTVPGYDWIFLSGGYSYRSDKLESDVIELKTNRGWGATKVYLPHNLAFDYRIVFARTLQDANDTETDNVVNTASIGKIWPRRAGLRLGYENRIADDLTDRTVSNGFLASCWYNHQNKLFLRGRVSVRSKSVDDGATLVGDEDFVRHSLSAKYSHKDWGTASVKWRSRIRENEDIQSEVNYDVITGQVTLKSAEYGKITVTHSYYLGQYENSSEGVDYEFSDHILSGHVYPVSYRGFNADFGGTYYRSRRDKDIEKFRLDFGVLYSFMKSYHLEARYNVYNYDNYLVNDEYYTANIVQVSIIKDVEL